MNGALIVILALAWALVILPGALRSRRSSPIGSVGTFERAMDVLARRDAPRGDGRVIYVPRDAARITGERTRRRNAVVVQRRRMFLRLAAATVVTLPPAAFLGGRWWALWAVVATTFAVYVVLLRRWKHQAEEAAEVVRTLPDVERAREVGEELRQVVGVGAPSGGATVVGRDEALYGGLPVATRPDDPWQPQSMVRIRRWEP